MYSPQVWNTPTKVNSPRKGNPGPYKLNRKQSLITRWYLFYFIKNRIVSYECTLENAQTNISIKVSIIQNRYY